MEGPGGATEDLALTLEQSDSVLTGQVTSESLDAPLPIENGTVRGDSFAFGIRVVRPNGPPRTYSFSGRVDGDRLTGTAGPEGGQPSTFSATRTSASALGGTGGQGERRQAARAPDASQPPDLQGSDPEPRNARQAVLAAFDRYEVVGMGILSYANQDFDQFILDLIRDPAFPDKVNDIEVECGNALYQAILDRYIAGDSVPLAEVEKVWRNTTQPFCGVTTFYHQLFPLVRRINEGLPAGRKLRVLAGDPAVDWSRESTRDELRPPDRDSSIAAVMEREVLSKHRKALMIFGVRHLMHGRGSSAVARYERAGYPNRTFVVMAHNGFGNGSPLGRYNDELERRMAAWPVPSLVSLQATWLDDLAFAYFLPDERGTWRPSDLVDAYLYLGPGRLLLNAPIPGYVVLDTAYMAALRRRIGAGGGPMAPDRILREAARVQVFFNDTLQ